MARYLVIVESPTKVKTIKKFLGSNYVVMASNGHVRDLPKSQMGVDLEHDFEPKYITIRGKGEWIFQGYSSVPFPRNSVSTRFQISSRPCFVSAEKGITTVPGSSFSPVLIAFTCFCT